MRRLSKQRRTWDIPLSIRVMIMQYRDTDTRQVRYAADSSLRSPALGAHTIWAFSARNECHLEEIEGKLSTQKRTKKSIHEKLCRRIKNDAKICGCRAGSHIEFKSNPKDEDTTYGWWNAPRQVVYQR